MKIPKEETVFRANDGTLHNTVNEAERHDVQNILMETVQNPATVKAIMQDARLHIVPVYELP